MNSRLRSCSVTVRPRSADQAAMSPPITPAPTTCTCLSRRGALAPERLQPILQQEDAHEVARGLGREQVRDGARFGLEGRRAARAIPRPEIDDRVGSRVVVAPRLGCDLRDQRALHEASARPASSTPARRTAPVRGGGRCVMSSRAAACAARAAGTSLSTSPRRSALSARTGLPGQHHLHRGRTPTSRTVRTVPPKPGWMPSCTSGQPERQPLIAHGDAVAARQCQLQPAAEREAVDRGDGRAGQRLEPVEHLLAARG